MANKNIFMTTNFKELEDKNKLWLENRKRRATIYNAITDYIEFLEKLLNYEQDEYEKYAIEQRIKNLKKQQEKYYDPCVLAMKLPGKNYGKAKEQNKGKLLIKRIFNKKI